MQRSITFLIICSLTVNLINSQITVDISQTIEKQIDGEWILFVNNEKFTGIVLQDWEDKTHQKTYKDGKLNGLYRAYYSYGNLAFSGNFKNGKKQGLCEWYYKNGKIKEKGNYYNGNQVDFHEWYYENGKIKEKSIIKNGEYTSTQKFPENVLTDSLKDDLPTLYDFLFGQDIFDPFYVPEVEISETELMNVDGQNITYYDGKRFTGIGLEYFSNGNIKQKGSFINGLKNGLFEWFYDNGNICYSVTYKYGERNGCYTEFHLNGNLKWKGIFRNDNYDGEWTEYDSNGDFIQTLTYKSGEKVN